MKKSLLTLAFALGILLTASAQELLSPSFTFSHKKTSYIFLKDGTQIKGTIKDLDRKKGLIEEVKIEDGNGKKTKLKPEDISHMYLPASGLDKLNRALDTAFDAQKWTDEKIDQNLVNDGYVYFENTMVKIKKKEMELMVQLLNPTFSKEIKVYHDPLAKETMSIGVGGIDVAGGLAKSYFVKSSSDNAAYKLEKKNYKEEFPGLWGSCPSIASEYEEVVWRDFTKHIISFTECK